MVEKIGYICAEELVTSLADFFSGKHPVKTADEINAEIAREHNAEIIIDEAHPKGTLGFICIRKGGHTSIIINPNKG